jgi:hypothetical protein
VVQANGMAAAPVYTSGQPSLPELLALVFVVLATFGIVAYFFDRFWWPPDEGVYAYVAERMLAGDVLYRDVQDLHAGYVQLLNAAAFALFGADLVSLRYPLAFATVVQALLVCLLLRARGPLAAIGGGLAAAALTFVQFLNPTANWYALFVAVLAIATLAWPSRSRGRWVVVGFLLGVLFLVRQLSGVLFAMGTLVYLLQEVHIRAPVPGSRAVLSRSLTALMALGLAGYLVANAELFGALLYGVWPLLILVWAFANVRPADRTVAGLIGWLLAGALLAAVPLVVYLGIHGAATDWLRDSFVTANRMTKLDFMSTSGYFDLLVLAVSNVVQPVDVVGAVNGLFWICLLATPPLVGVLTLRCLLRTDQTSSRTLAHPLVLTVPFFALVSVHFQIPIYLFFSAAPLLWALLWLAGEWSSPARRAVAVVVVTLSMVGLLWQAGQPLSRGWAGIVAGRTVALDAPAVLPKASLRIEARDYATYRRLLDVIDRYAGPTGSLLAVPVNPELYFLSGRRPSVKFFSTAIGLRTEGDLREARGALRADPPAVIVRRPRDKYNTPLGDALLASLLGDYALVDKVADFEVWAASRRLSSVSVAKDAQRATTDR